MTNRDKAIAGLRATGWEFNADHGTSKYLAFEHPERAFRLLIGKSGALRKTVGPVSSSLSLTGSFFHRALRTVGERAASYSSVEQARADLAVLMGKPAAAVEGGVA